MALAMVVGQNAGFTKCFASSEVQAEMCPHLLLVWSGWRIRLDGQSEVYWCGVGKLVVSPPRGHFWVKVKNESSSSSFCESWEGSPSK